MRELINKLNYYTKLYNKGHTEITDQEWDSLYFELKKIQKETKKKKKKKKKKKI